MAEAVTAEKLDLQAILLTHAHLDHVEGVHLVRGRGAGRPDLAAPGGSGHVSGAASAGGGVRLGRCRLSRSPTDELAHGQRFTFGECAFDVRFTPGHAPGHVIFVSEDAGLALWATWSSRVPSGGPTFPAGTSTSSCSRSGNRSSRSPTTWRSTPATGGPPPWASNGWATPSWCPTTAGSWHDRRRPIGRGGVRIGGGTNFQALLDHQDADTPWRIGLLVTDRTGAGALARAEAAGVPPGSSAPRTGTLTTWRSRRSRRSKTTASR